MEGKTLLVHTRKELHFVLPAEIDNRPRKKKNLFHIEHPAGIENEKMPNLRKLESEERVSLGLKAFPERMWKINR